MSDELQRVDVHHSSQGRHSYGIEIGQVTTTQVSPIDDKTTVILPAVMQE